MIEHIFKNINKKDAERYKYISASFIDVYYAKQKNIIKNYVLAPDKILLTFNNCTH